MTQKNFWYKAKLALEIFLNEGEKPGTANGYTKTKMALYLVMFVIAIVVGFARGIQTMSISTGIISFLGMLVLWFALVFWTKAFGSFN